MLKAFLLTRQWRDKPTGIELELWLSSDQGPVSVVIQEQQAVFFIHQEDVEKLQQLLPHNHFPEVKNLQLKSFYNKPVAGVYFTSQQVLYRARDCLKQNCIHYFEADIRAPERYLTERFLTGPVSLQVNRKFPARSVVDQSLENWKNPLIKPADYTPLFRVISLDIETAYDSKKLYSISLLDGRYKITLMLDETADQNDIGNEHHRIETLSSERQLLQRFIELICHLDPDIIIGWNVINFDFRFLQDTADRLKLSLAIGRRDTLAVWRKAQNEQTRWYLLIPGRVVLDGIDSLKSATWRFESFSLEFVAQQLLGRGKLIKHTDVEYNSTQTIAKPARAKKDPLYKAKEIKRLFKEDKKSLAKYNLQDCQLVWDIFKHAGLIDFISERSRLTGLEMDRFGGSVAAFDNLYLPRLHRMGYVAPNIDDYQEQISAPGGYVMDSQPGLYDSVLVLDYKSLYPSIIRTFKVDPLARIMAKSQPENEIVPGFNGASFSKQDNILPDIIKSLWEARDQAKKDLNLALSQAIKIIMNSFYGVLGTPGCRIHDARLTSSITLRGHEIMKQTMLLIEEQGYKVIYGDTDSVFVSLGSPFGSRQADRIGNNLVEKINRYWRFSLDQRYRLKSFLEMEYETHFVKFFMPTIRGSTKGSKKRYAGLIRTSDEGENKIIYKGLETVRTDWTRLAREVQQGLYLRVFNHEPYNGYLLEIITSLKAGLFDDKLIYRKRLRQPLSDYQKNIPPHAQAAIKAAAAYEKMKAGKADLANRDKERYHDGGWVEYVITLNGPEMLECQASPLDYEHYIKRQIAPAVDSLLQVLGDSLEKITQEQYELF